MTQESLALWAGARPLSPLDIDCAVAVMLKILDGKCKMRPAEKIVMIRLYDLIKTKPGQLLDSSLHSLIAAARDQSDDETLKMRVYEQRLFAETAISRPVMKKFKAFIRAEGLLEDNQDSADDD